MSLRFQKRIRIAPGLKINVGLSGVSLSAGPRGSSVTVGKRGVYSNVGASGTGFSYRKKLSGGSRKKTSGKYNEFAQIKAEISENGTFTLKTMDGEALSRAQTKAFWEQNGVAVLNQFENIVDEINGNSELITNIHMDTPYPNTSPVYEVKPYDHLPPIKPKPLSISRFLTLLFSEKEINPFKAQRRLTNEYVHKMDEWNLSKEAHNQAEIKIKERFDRDIETNIQVIDSTLQTAIQSLSWPLETTVSYEIRNKGTNVWLDVDLPEIEDLPKQTATIASSGRRIYIKDKTEKKLREEYAKHIHGVIFRLTGTTFASVPRSKNVIISGYSQRFNKATGKIIDEYLMSFNIDRENFSKIDFQSLNQVDPIEALDVFEHKKKMTVTGIFKGIIPYEVPVS